MNRWEGLVSQTWNNHSSANRYLLQITNYLAKEIVLDVMLGPFVTSPFPSDMTGILPMSTQPKKGTSKHRIIVDLSWPIGGASVNSLIPKDHTLVHLVVLYILPQTNCTGKPIN